MGGKARAAAVATAWSAAVELVLPRYCIGCTRPGRSWCARCRPASVPVRTEIEGVPVVAAARYDGALARAIVHYKDRGRRDLASPLVALLADAVTRALADPMVRPVAGDVPAVLVPVPSTPAALRRRGGSHLVELGRGTGLPVLDAVRLDRRVRDSVGLDAGQRRANLTGAVRAGPPAAGVRAVVIDDLVTTGASLSATVAALRGAGWRVVAGAAIAVTQ